MHQVSHVRQRQSRPVRQHGQLQKHIHHDRPVRHDLLRRHQLPIANTDSKRSHSECPAQHGRIFEQPECHVPWQIAINQAITSNTQSQVTLKNIGPGFLYFTQLSEAQLLTRFLYSQVVPVSFFPQVNLFLTFPWTKVRNR